MDDNKPNLEREIKSLQQQIEEQRSTLEKQTVELSLLEQNIEILYHDIFQKNNEIQAIENEQKDQFKDNAARLQFEQEIKQEQQDQLLKTKFQKTSEKSRNLVEEFYLNRYKTHSEKLMNSQVKLEVQSVKIMFLKGDPSEYLEKNNRNSTTVQFVVQTFSINKQTLIKDLFESAIDYFQISIAKKDDHVLTDTNFNDLTLIENYPAESFFSSQKETTMYAEMYLKPKYLTQSVLLDKQQESIQLGDTISSLQTTVDTERKNLQTVFNNFEKVFTGISLYSTQAKDDQNMMIMQKVKNRFWINIFHMILYITVIAAIISRLQQNSDPDVFNIKSNSDYFLQTFSQISDPIQDNKFFLKSLNGFSRNFKFANSTDFSKPPETQEIPLYSSYISLGTVRIVLKKTKVKECNQITEYTIDSEVVGKSKCSEPIITDSSETKETINGLQWSSDSETGLDRVQGFLGSYSGSGYKMDFDPYILDKNEYLTAINNLQSHIDYQTKAVIVYGCFYDINKKTFLSVYYVVDISTSGIYIENQDVYYFMLFYQDEMDSAHTQVYRTSIACIALMSLIFVITIFINIDRTYQTFKLNKDNRLKMRTRDIFIKLLSFQMVSEICILGFIIVAHIFIYDTPDIPFNDLIQTQHPSFVNIHKYGYQQEVAHRLLALGLILLVLFLAINIPLDFELQNFQRMIQNSISPLIVIMCLIFTLICSIALILQRVFGPYIVEFSTYEDAFYETIFVYFFGDYKIQQQMWDKNLILSLAIIGVVVLTIFYGSVALFNSVLFEKYRLVSTKLQFNQQQIDVAGKFNEKLQNLKSVSCFKCFKKSNNAPKQKTDKKPSKKPV